MQWLCTVGSLLVVLLSVSRPAEAALWVGHTGYGAAEWVLVDTQTGEATTIPSEIRGYYSLALAQNGPLYALENGVFYGNDGYFASRLYAVDTTTFAATQIARFVTDARLSSLAFARDGSLLATGNPILDGNGGVANGALAYQIDPHTLSIEEVGTWWSEGLATAPVDVKVAGFGTVAAGTLFGNYINALWIMDPGTGVRTTIESSVNRINVDNSIAFGPDGTLYTTYGAGGNVYRVDLTTMTQTRLYSHQVSSMSFQGGEVLPAPVPEPSSLIVWSLVGLTFIGVGWHRRRVT